MLSRSRSSWNRKFRPQHIQSPVLETTKGRNRAWMIRACAGRGVTEAALAGRQSECGIMEVCRRNVAVKGSDYPRNTALFSCRLARKRWREEHAAAVQSGSDMAGLGPACKSSGIMCKGIGSRQCGVDATPSYIGRRPATPGRSRRQKSSPAFGLTLPCLSPESSRLVPRLEDCSWTRGGECCRCPSLRNCCDAAEAVELSALFPASRCHLSSRTSASPD